MSERIAAAASFLPFAHRAKGAFRQLLADSGGSTAIEYAMIGGLIFAVIAGSLKLYGSKMSGVYGQIGSAIAQVN